MYFIRQLKRNFKHLLCNYLEAVGTSSGKNNSKENLVNKENLPSIEEQKSIIKDLLTNEDINKGIVSLDNDTKLKQKILNGIENNTLSEKQINTIYNELNNIKNVEKKIITPDVIKKIEQESANDRFKKISIKIKKIKELASIEQKKDILEAESYICETLGICENINK